MAVPAVSAEGGIGASPRRKETERFIQGGGQYVDDILLPRQTYAVFVRSLAAHARIQGIDSREALALPGVLGVYTAADLAPAMSRCPLATDRARFVGDPIAIVLGETRYAAQDGASAVVVEYDSLPPVLDPEAAMAPGSPRVYDEYERNVVQELHMVTEGLEEAFAAADLVVRERFHTQRLSASPMEPRGVCASYDKASGELTVWTSTSGVHGVRTNVSEGLRMSESQVRIIAPDVGGSFGAKNGTYPEEILIAALAVRAGRPIKWTETRTEHLALGKHGRDQTHYVELAVRKDGRVLALRDRIIADLGATARADNSVTAAFLYMTGAYAIQAVAVEAYGVATNKTPHGSVRGIGKADAAYVIERMMDIAARRLGMDSAEIRLRNFVPEEAFPYRTATGAVLDSGRYAEALRKAMDLAGYDELRRQQADATSSRVRRGVGVSFVIEPTGAARRNVGGGYGACRMRMEPTGTVSVFPSLGAQGQGHVTTISQIAADRLRVPVEDVHVFEADTSSTPFGSGTGSSRSSATLMPAVYVAAEQLKEKMLRIAAHRLEVDAADLDIDGKAVFVRGAPERKLSFRDIARVAYLDVDQLPRGMDPALDVTGYFVNPNIGYERDERGRHNEFAAYPYEAVVSAVDVDLQTGAVTIVKYASVHDCGTMLNPRIVLTQHIGCIAQGLGAALFEEIRYDEDGQLLTGTFMDYLLPTVNEMPELQVGHLETPTPFTPLGAKGAGETGTLSPPAALGNAIEDALAPLGVKLRNTPFTPDRIRALVREAEAEETAARG